MRNVNKAIAGNPNVVDNNNCNSGGIDLSSISNPPVKMNSRSRPPPFLAKLYSMVVDPETNDIISWSSTKNSFIIWDRHKFSSLVLPKYFKHSNFPSFNYQLNNYGFNKMNWEWYEFANPLFVEGRVDLLIRIRRKHDENRGVIDQGNDSLHGRSLMEATMEILRSEQKNLELQLQELREKQEHLVHEFPTIEDNTKATLEDQERLNTKLAVHLVQQYVSEHLKECPSNDEDPTLNQTEVKPVTAPLDDSGRSTQGQKIVADDLAFWKKIMEDDSS